MGAVSLRWREGASADAGSEAPAVSASPVNRALAATRTVLERPDASVADLLFAVPVAARLVARRTRKHQAAPPASSVRTPAP